MKKVRIEIEITPAQMKAVNLHTGYMGEKAAIAEIKTLVSRHGLAHVNSIVDKIEDGFKVKL